MPTINLGPCDCCGGDGGIGGACCFTAEVVACYQGGDEVECPPCGTPEHYASLECILGFSEDPGFCDAWLDDACSETYYNSYHDLVFAISACPASAEFYSPPSGCPDPPPDVITVPS